MYILWIVCTNSLTRKQRIADISEQDFQLLLVVKANLLRHLILCRLVHRPNPTGPQTVTASSETEEARSLLELSLISKKRFSGILHCR
jgi:hypothetical protein